MSGLSTLDKFDILKNKPTISLLFNTGKARELKPAIEAIHFITEKLRLEDEQEMVEDDWQYIAMILDRLILYLYSFGCILGTILVFYRIWSIEPWNVVCTSHPNYVPPESQAAE